MSVWCNRWYNEGFTALVLITGWEFFCIKIQKGTGHVSIRDVVRVDSTTSPIAQYNLVILFSSYQHAFRIQLPIFVLSFKEDLSCPSCHCFSIVSKCLFCLHEIRHPPLPVLGSHSSRYVNIPLFPSPRRSSIGIMAYSAFILHPVQSCQISSLYSQIIRSD